MKNKSFQNKIDRILQGEKIPSAGVFILMSIPGAENPWFIYNKLTRKTVTAQGFKTYETAKNYLLTEFSK